MKLKNIWSLYYLNYHTWTSNEHTMDI